MALLPLAAITFSLVSLPPAVFAQTFNPVFSKQYTRSVGTPATVSDEFTACDPGGSFRLVVLNGPGGQWRISSGSIFVNGVEVVKEQDFSQQVERIERPLSNIAHSNSVEVRLRSRPEAAIEVTVEAVQSCGIRITAPAPGSVFTEPVVLVRGTVPVPPGGEVGVTVNGVLALVDAGQFAALVPVNPDMTTLTATAADAAGTVSSDTITVVARPSTFEPLLLFQAAPTVGVAPLTVVFSLPGAPTSITIELDFDGNGSIDFRGPRLEGQAFTYTQPGLYLPMLTTTDASGNLISASAVVQVYDRANLDALLQAKWRGIRDALRRGDIESALRFIAMDSRDEFRADFTTLTPFLPTFASALEDIRLVALRGEHIEYELVSVENSVAFSYYVEFIRDADGIWRLAFF